MRRTVLKILAAAGLAAVLSGTLGIAQSPEIVPGGRDGLIEKAKSDLGMLGWRGRRDPSIRDPKEAAKDLEQRRMQQEKEKRIGDARKAGAAETYDAHHRALFRRNREDAAARRRLEWRAAANPGS
ncbi:MAG: hypothetical protein MUE73_08735 [Planctomycetes bacterium]|nr:hypothetical protein [Planctomycetota bacterium]